MEKLERCKHEGVKEEVGKGDVEVREKGGTTSVYPSKGEKQVELEGKKRYGSIFSEKKLWD